MADTPDPTDQAILQYAPDWYQDNSREFPSHSLDDDPDNDDKKKNKKDSKNNNEDEDEDEDEDDDNDEDDNDDDDDTKDDNDDDSDNSTDKIIKTATRSHDKSVQTNASQRQGDQHAPLFVPQPPAKFANHGQWEFIEFVPGWTDPIWDGHETVKIDDHHKHLVRKKAGGGILDRLRPAQLPQDRSRNPTPFAMRWGIHPDRRDGRSRLSPTRSAFRRFRVDDHDTIQVVGDYIVKQAEIHAAAAGAEDVEALLETYSRLTPGGESRQPSATEQFVVQAMQDIRDDEDWQSLVFSGLTTQELLDDGILSLKNTYGCNLENDLHGLLQRDKWDTATWRGGEPDTPRLVYQAGKVKGEWDPSTNDDLWKRMQPALQVASRILTHLEHHDPYWARLMDVFNRVPIPPFRDPRPPHQRKKYPAWNFRMRDDDAVSRAAAAAAAPWTVAEPDVRAAVDAVGTTWRTLHSCLRFELNTGFDVDMVSQTLAGSTAAQGEKIVVMLAVDCLWPLVVEGYSHDEKISSCFSVAATIIHELAHAVNYAHIHWLYRPGPAADQVADFQKHPELEQKLVDIGESLFGKQDLKKLNPIEPYFENQQKSELGFATDGHVFGGSNWQTLSQSNLSFKHLNFLPSGSLMVRWPTGFNYSHGRMQTWEELKKSPAAMVLRTPPIVVDTYRVPVKVAEVARLFSEGFWRSEVVKFGTAALKLGTADPTRVRFLLDDPVPVTKRTGDISDICEKVMELYPDADKLAELGGIVWEFLDRLLLEYFLYPTVRFRWQKDYNNLYTRLGAIDLGAKQFSLAIKEVQILDQYLRCSARARRGGGNVAAQLDAWKTTTLQLYRAQIQKCRDSSSKVSFELPLGSDRLQNDATFWDRIGEVGTFAQRRFDGLLRTLYDLLSTEIDRIHEMYIDIYRLSPEERGRMRRRKCVQNLLGRLDILEKACRHTIVGHGGISALRLSFDVRPHFAQSFTVLMQRIKELVPWAHDVREINPANAHRLTPFIPNIRKARRPASARMVKLAQKEINLMSVEDLIAIEPFLLFVKHRLEAADAIEMDLTKDQKDHLELIVERMKAAYVPAAADDDGGDDDNSSEEGEPLTKIIRKRKNRGDDLASGQHVVRRRRIYVPRLSPPVLRHPRPLSSSTRPPHDHWRRRRSFGGIGSAARRGPSVASPSLQPPLPNPFASMPSITFPLANQGLSPAFSSQSTQQQQQQQQPPPQAFNAFPEQMPVGPQPTEIFPHPGALSATFTQDLVAERDYRAALAAQSSSGLSSASLPPRPPPSLGSPLQFSNRPGLWDAPREVAPLIPDSPESERGRRQVPDPQRWSPLTESLSSIPPSNPGSTGSPEQQEEEEEQSGSGFVDRLRGRHSRRSSLIRLTAYADTENLPPYPANSVAVTFTSNNPAGGSGSVENEDSGAAGHKKATGRRRAGWRPDETRMTGVLSNPMPRGGLGRMPGGRDLDWDQDMEYY
ncbi:hypothetical protein CH35J_005134 [Colletotrichum higginsianum]|uniref:Uncharacterized protein n=1 Tax=Colletotrichum higginsianum TaxID=80884 RepID=A0A4T0W409_9PEZI|nr:hypothetical protein CH35J_005134 [Colletotrichum higginsianum]